MAELTVIPKNKKEEQIITAILNGLQVKYFTEEQENIALANAIMQGMKSKTLTKSEKNEFLASLIK
jgi:hypothetical protein